MLLCAQCLSSLEDLNGLLARAPSGGGINCAPSIMSWRGQAEGHRFECAISRRPLTLSVEPMHIRSIIPSKIDYYFDLEAASKQDDQNGHGRGEEQGRGAEQLCRQRGTFHCTSSGVNTVIVKPLGARGHGPRHSSTSAPSGHHR